MLDYQLIKTLPNHCLVMFLRFRSKHPYRKWWMRERSIQNESGKPSICCLRVVHTIPTNEL